MGGKGYATEFWEEGGGLWYGYFCRRLHISPGELYPHGLKRFVFHLAVFFPTIAIL